MSRFIYSSLYDVPRATRELFTPGELYLLDVCPLPGGRLPSFRRGIPGPNGKAPHRHPHKLCVVCGHRFDRAYQTSAQWKSQKTCGWQHAGLLRKWTRAFGFDSADDLIAWPRFPELIRDAQDCGKLEKIAV